MATPYQKPNGKWCVDLKHGGRRVKITAATRRDVLRDAAARLLSMGVRPSASTVTVEQLIAEWRTTVDHSPGYEADVSAIIRRLPVEFLDLPIDNVTAADIARLYTTLGKGTIEGGKVVRKGLSPHRIHRVHCVLLPSFKLAVRYEWTTRNPVAAVNPPKLPKHEIRPPTPAEVGQLLAEVAGTPMGLYLELAAVTGARRGELVALKWDDLDGCTLKIRRSASWTPADANATWETGIVIGDTKTHEKGHRVIAIPQHIATALSALQHRYIVDSLAMGVPGRPEWMFSHDLGHTCWLPGYPSLEFRRMRKRLGLDSVRLHDLRHFMATQLLAAGVPIATVAHRVGHSSATTTQRFYSHYVLAADQDAADVMDRVLRFG